MNKLKHALVYYTCAPFIYFVSILPWPVLFFFSDLFFVLLFYILRYRRKVVRTNLINSFPEKSPQEIKIIEFRFYRYFSDLVFEIFKLFTLSDKQKMERCKMSDETLALFNDLYSRKKSGILIMGHYGNWEFCPAGLPQQIKFQSYCIYRPLSNPYFDQLMYRMRTKTSCKLYTMAGTLKGMMTDRYNLNITAFLSDQSPDLASAYWTTFLNQDTPVYIGSEKISMKLGLAVLYGSMERTGRGRYIYHARLICEDASSTKPLEITNAHVKQLESDISKNPEYWLWTHRRWKHIRPNLS